jgi:hypothetical protein
MAFFSAAVFKEGHADNVSKAAPATCGVAIEVPLKLAYCPFRIVE